MESMYMYFINGKIKSWTCYKDFNKALEYAISDLKYMINDFDNRLGSPIELSDREKDWRIAKSYKVIEYCSDYVDPDMDYTNEYIIDIVRLSVL